VGVVTSGYDEWVRARTPSLLRFAYLLSGDAETTDVLVTGALGRVASGWTRLVRTGDPDREAWAAVVSACPGRAAPVPVPVGGASDDVTLKLRPAFAALSVRRRAAVVLRHAEQRPDTEIGDVLGCSGTIVRAQLARAHDVVRDRLGPRTPNNQELGRRLAAALASWADEAPSSLQQDPPTTSDEGRPRRRGGVLAALAVIALLGTITIVDHAASTPAGVITYPHLSTPPTWRAESYDGVEVQVPGTWGWGGAPFRSDLFAHHLGACGADTAAVQSPTDSSSYISSATGFVGRPAMLSDVCVPWGADGVFPSGDALWFGSPLPVGVRAVSTGIVAETRAVGTQHVTVFADSSQLRRQILGTAHTVGVDAYGCPTDGVEQPTPGGVTPSGVRPTSISVCVYSQDTGTTALQWSGEVGTAAARAYVDAVRTAGETGPGDCGSNPSGQWVALGVHGSPGIRWDVVDLACDRILTGGDRVMLSAADAKPWAVPGARAYVFAGNAVPADLRGLFHAPPG
jgi:hypothetical protein